MIQAGFQVISIDLDSNNAHAPIATLDLTTSSGQRILWDILKSPNVFAIHMGLPCGTSSRARERPISKALIAAGVPQPKPLRDATHPMGIPGVGPTNQARLDSANTLYKLALEIMAFCFQKQILVSVENPTNSWLWTVFIFLLRDFPENIRSSYNALVKTTFHACCHGSRRRKDTGWLATPGVYEQLQARCNNDHEHEPFGVRWNGHSWTFDTASEAEYPQLLAQRATRCLVQAALQAHWSLKPPPRLHDLSTAAHGRQSRKHKPVIPEFHHISTLPGTDPKSFKPLLPHLEGDSALEEGAIPTSPEQGGKKQKNVETKFGHYHSPKQFLSRAKTVSHPMDASDHLHEVTRYALDFNFRYPDHVVKLERKKNLLQAKLWAKQLEESERVFQDGLPSCVAKVLKGKKVLLWEKLLEKFGYDDMKVVDFMKKGVPLVGAHDTPACYPVKLKPATLTMEDLDGSALWRRRAALGKRTKFLEPDHVSHLEETAKEELCLGFVEGPFESEDQVSKFFGHTHWSVVRRFVLVQGAEQKLRPIDDCLESQLNQAFTSTSYLALQDVDYVTGLALRVAQMIADGTSEHGREQWLGKCLDLSKAYKQVPIHPDHRHLAVIFYHDANQVPKFLVANALMFGAVAAVFAFNRLSRSLWFLLNKMLVIPCGVFYDDFPMVAPQSSAANADESASELLDLLGWRHAHTGPKGLPFEQAFQVLGCSLDLSNILQGTVVLANKAGRVERILERFSSLRSAGKITLHESQVLHGLLRYATGFFAGKGLHQVCAELMAFGTKAASFQGECFKKFCDYAIGAISQSQPREIRVGGERCPILIFTDGAWEDGRAGIGAVVIDAVAGYAEVFHGVVPDELLKAWGKVVGEFLICQIELYIMVLIRWTFRERLTNRRAIWWVDNDAARFALIKGMSPSLTMRDLVREFYRFENTDPSFGWIERVPSFSNPADGPSRSQPGETLELLGLSESRRLEHPPDLLRKLCST